MSIEIKSLKPVYGDNYKKGYIGFTYYDSSIVSIGIAYMTRWARMGDIKVSHTLLITGENECIEAHMENGVQRSDMRKYFDDENRRIFFRKPVGLNEKIADNLERIAANEIGTRYDVDLIASHALEGSFIGQLINKVFDGKPDKLISKLLNHDDRWICSELVAHCLSGQKEYRHKGILRRPDETINPQELFEDEIIFEPWTQIVKNRK
jgi:hypothetical protein